MAGPMIAPWVSSEPSKPKARPYSLGHALGEHGVSDGTPGASSHPGHDAKKENFPPVGGEGKQTHQRGQRVVDDHDGLPLADAVGVIRHPELHYAGGHVRNALYDPERRRSAELRQKERQHRGQHLVSHIREQGEHGDRQHVAGQPTCRWFRFLLIIFYS